jgi:hypothetical protein
MRVEDRYLPHFLGGVLGDQANSEPNLVIGSNQGMFQLISVIMTVDGKFSYESILERPTWREFLLGIRDEFAEVFVIDPEDMNLYQLEIFGEGDQRKNQVEVLRRAKEALETLNECNRILRKQGVTVDVSLLQHQSLTDLDASIVSVRYLREIK